MTTENAQLEDWKLIEEDGTRDGDLKLSIVGIHETIFSQFSVIE